MQHIAGKTPGASSAANQALAVGAESVFVWMADLQQADGGRHYVQRIILDSPSLGAYPVHDWCVHVGAFDHQPQPQPRRGDGQQMQMACDAAGGACLLLGPGRVVVQCQGGGPAANAAPRVHTLAADMDTMAVAAAAGPSWLMLSSTYGVIEASTEILAEGSARGLGGIAELRCIPLHTCC